MQTTTLTPRERHFTFISMRCHGGNFCRYLAEAWFAADPINRARIEEAFPHLLKKYGPNSPLYVD